jgi:4-hydroxy-2-oxoheptanedioate aldolase
MDHHINLVRKRLAAGATVIGAKIDLPSPDIVEIVGRSGYDFAWIDCEHGTIDLETAVHMMRAADAAGVTPIVRVPEQSASAIARMLDAGAMGIVVPGISTGAQAAAAVRAAKYQTAEFPEGRRGACPRIRATGHQVRDWNTYAKWANDETMLWLLVETLAGADNIEDIVSVPGIHALMLGPFDLSISMGYPGETQHPRVVEKLELVTKAARRRNIEVVPVLLSGALEDLRKEKQHWLDRGCRIFNVVSDRRLLARELAVTLEAMR